MFDCPLPLSTLIPALSPDISLLIANLLNIGDLMKLRRLSSTGDAYVGVTISHRSRILLNAYIRDINNFVHEMRVTSTVIGGEAALRILYPDCPRPSVIKLYCPRTLFHHILSYLVYIEGYTFTLVRPHHTDHVEQPPTIAHLVNGQARIHLVQSPTDSPLHPLTTEWNTALYTFVSPTHYVVPYPHDTAAGRVCYITPRYRRYRHGESKRSGIIRLVRSWEVREWIMADKDSDEGWVRPICDEGSQGMCSATARVFGDRFCLSGPIHAIRSEPIVPMRYNPQNLYNVLWFRGGFTCGDQRHGGLEEVRPAARVCLRRVTRGM